MESRQRSLPRTRSRRSPAGDHGTASLNDTIQDLTDQESHLEAQLEKLQEKKKSLMRLLQPKPQHQNTEISAESPKVSDPSLNSPSVATAARKTRPRERLGALTDQSRDLNEDLQRALKELTAKGPATEFQENDPYNFLNTYMRKVGYLQAGQKTKKRPLMPSRERNVVSENTVKKDDYLSDFETSVGSPATKERVHQIPSIESEKKENVERDRRDGEITEKSASVVEKWLENSFGKGTEQVNIPFERDVLQERASGAGLSDVENTKRQGELLGTWHRDVIPSPSPPSSLTENDTSLLENEPPPRNDFFLEEPKTIDLEQPRFSVLNIPPLNFANLRAPTTAANDHVPHINDDSHVSKSSSTTTSVPFRVESPSSRSSSPKRLSTPEGSASERSVAFSLNSVSVQSDVTPKEPLTPRGSRFEIEETNAAHRTIAPLETDFPVEFVPLHPVILPVDSDIVEKIVAETSYNRVLTENDSTVGSIIERIGDEKDVQSDNEASTEGKHQAGGDYAISPGRMGALVNRARAVSPLLSPSLSSIPDAFADDFDTPSEEEPERSPNKSDVESFTKKTEADPEEAYHDTRSDIASVRSDFLSSHSEVGGNDVSLQDFDNTDVDAILSNIVVHDRLDDYKLDAHFPPENLFSVESQEEETFFVSDELNVKEKSVSEDDVISESSITLSIVRATPVTEHVPEIKSTEEPFSSEQNVDTKGWLIQSRNEPTDTQIVDDALESAKSSSSGNSILDELLGRTKLPQQSSATETHPEPLSPRVLRDASPSLSPERSLKPVDIPLPSDDWMEDDFFTTVHNAAVMPEVSETVTESTDKLRKQGEYTRHHKVDSFYSSAEFLCRYVHRRAFSGINTVFADIPPVGDQTEEQMMLFDGIIDLCEQMFLFPSSSTRPLLASKVKLPVDADQFVAIVWKSVEGLAARMVLPDVALHAGRLEQDDVEQQTVYDLAFQDLERNEAQWCDFKDSENILKEECVNVIWNDLINEYLVELQKIADTNKERMQVTETVLGW